jgi:hypothetical protein
VKELETELARAQSRGFKTSIPSPEETPDSTSPESAHPSHVSLSTSSQQSGPVAAPGIQTFQHMQKPQWEGIYVATARSDQTSYYGPASYFYFVSRIGSFLARVLQQPFADRQMQPKGANRNVILGNGHEEDEERDGTKTQSTGGHVHAPSMSRTQEEYWMSLFWEGYHCFMPVVDETELRRHYASLWEPGKPYRRPSPLVDIILALCLQYGYTFIPRDASKSSDRDASFDDATIAGRWYYRRSQALLTADLESPSITTVQCYIFTTTYLCCASFQNMCHVVNTQCVRMAQILGLHLEPPADLPRGERELRKRIWWAIWFLDSKISSKLGRPFAVDPRQTTVSWPSDDMETATYNGALLGSHGPSVTWLTYFLQMNRLNHTMADIHDALYNKFGEIMASKGLTSPYKDPRVLETCAEFLAVRIQAMRAWVDQVPQGLKTRRRGGGEPFSNDRSALEVESMAPTWIQRQRACLELIYYAVMTNLTRPFITFYSNSSTYTPIAERHAASCVSYAISHTHIMHQLVTETDLMGGWSEFFLWQWNAAITIAGFIMAYPIHPSTPGARRALDKAIAVFDKFGADFAVSASAAAIARDLVAKADLLTGRLRNEITSGPASVTAGSPATNAPTPNATGNVSLGVAGPGMGDGSGMDAGGMDSLAWLDPSQQNDPTYFSEFMDWAVSVDSFNSFERFFDANNPVDPWAFAQQHYQLQPPPAQAVQQQQQQQPIRPPPPPPQT